HKVLGRTFARVPLLLGMADALAHPAAGDVLEAADLPLLAGLGTFGLHGGRGAACFLGHRRHEGQYAGSNGERQHQPKTPPRCRTRPTGIVRRDGTDEIYVHGTLSGSDPIIGDDRTSRYAANTRVPAPPDATATGRKPTFRGRGNLTQQPGMDAAPMPEAACRRRSSAASGGHRTAGCHAMCRTGTAPGSQVEAG